MDEISHFTFQFHYIFRNPVDGDGEKLVFYNVYVHDRNLINYLKGNLQKNNRVFVNGFINYKPDIDQNGKKAFSGFIEATNIFKIERFSELSNENPIIRSVSE